METTLAIGHNFLRGLCAAVLIAVSAASAQANWLTKIAREAGELGTSAARHGISGLDRAALHLKALPKAGGGGALAAHATPEGHWKFVNRDGEIFTAGTPDELKLAVPTLLPDAAADAKLTLYLSEGTVFKQRAQLKDLPEGASLRIVVGKDSYPLVKRTNYGHETLNAAVRPNLIVELTDDRLFDEAIAQFERPLARSSIRTLALEPGGPATLSSSPRLEPDTKAALVDAIDPPSLPRAMSNVRGQTVLVTGRVENDLLFFQPSSGSEQTLKVLDLIDAAAASDVNLVIMHAPSPRQPGGRNWFWQKISVNGLDNALKRATLGDFLDALGASNGELQASITREGSGRVAIRAVPAGDAEPIGGVVGDWLSTAVSEVTGNVVTSAVDVHARDEARQRELDDRIVPFIPSDYQYFYLAGVITGIMGWQVTRAWWARLWPPESRGEYRGVIGYRAAQVARFLAFAIVFLPLVGMPAFIASVAMQVYGVAMLPFRFLRWIIGLRQASTG